MHYLLTLLLQIGVILVVCRLVSLLFRRIGQPQVVGEMVAGIVLGPSLLGLLFPDFSAALFPPESLVHLNTLSQVGLVVFMFLVGLEFDPKLLRGRGHAALVTSHVSIVAPFFLGSLLALLLYPQLSDSSVAFDGFALFMGAAMSVTAFPVLARILQERNLMRTKVGAIAIACAAIDDVTAWGILAIVVAIVRASSLHTPLWLTLIGSVAYVGVMLVVVRPALRLLEKRYHRRGRVSHDLIAVVLVLVLASAWTTEWLGIHALFGAFCLGAVMPKDRGLVHELTEKVEPVIVVFLLPIFFANAGLRTSIGLVSGAEMWGFFGLIMLVAVGGKFGGSTLAARMTGLGWHDASAVGVLMNTRGLMELVILTIGLDLGVISPALFAMLVMMALATTFMTTPILQWLYPMDRLRETARDAGEPEDFTVVVPVSLPASGPGLLRVAEALVPPGRRARIYGAHLRRATETTEIDLGEAPQRDAALDPLLTSAAERGTPVRPVVFTSERPGHDIADLARTKGADLVLMGWHKPVVSSRILGGAVNEVMSRAETDVGVYVERGVVVARVAVGNEDACPGREAALDVAGRIAASRNLPVTVLHVPAPEDDVVATADELINRLLMPPELRSLVDVRVLRSEDALDALVEEVQRGEHDLVVIGVAPTWGLTPSFFGVRHERLAAETEANLLILRRHVHGQPVPAPKPAPREVAAA